MTDDGSRSSHRCQVISGSSLSPWICRQRPMPRYKLSEWWSLEHGLESAHMEDGITFGCFVVSPLFSSSLLWISAQYKWRQVGMGFYYLPMEVEFPHAPDPLKSCQWAVPIGSGTYDFVWTHTQHECIMLCVLSFSLVRFMQPRKSSPNEADNVTVTRDCAHVTAILYSRLATRVRSLAMIIPIQLFTITWVHNCNRIPIINVHMNTLWNAAICALTVCPNTPCHLSYTLINRLLYELLQHNFACNLCLRLTIYIHIFNAAADCTSEQF